MTKIRTKTIVEMIPRSKITRACGDWGSSALEVFIAEYASSLFAGRSEDRLGSFESDVEPNQRPTIRSLDDRDKVILLHPWRDPLPRRPPHQCLIPVAGRCGYRALVPSNL